jgi:uncharacterized protein (TIGR03083 family)
MTAGAIEALRADRDVLIELCEGLATADWARSSACAGWSVQDLVAHMGCLFWLVVDPSALPDTGELPTEDAQEQCVQARRSWTAAQVLDDYATVSAKALDALVGLEALDMEVPLGDLGTYHASVLPNAYTFDHYTHIRADLCAPRGPLPNGPGADELHLVPTIDWIVAAAPQQNATALGALNGVIEISVHGLGARTFTLGSGDARARVECSGHDLVLWATQRATWGELDVEATGSLAALDVAQHLHVF